MSDIEIIQLDGGEVIPIEVEDLPSGGGGVTTAYTHIQSTPQSVWDVYHALGRYPAAFSLHDDSDVLCSNYRVQHMDLNSLRVSMDTPIAGTFRCI